MISPDSIVLGIVDVGTRAYPLLGQIAVNLTDHCGAVYEPKRDPEWVPALPPGRADFRLIPFDVPHFVDSGATERASFELWVSDTRIGWYAIYALE